MIVNLESAGFNTGFTSIYWIYASGFPKAMNVSKAVDKKLGVKRKLLGYEPASSQNIKNANMHIIDKPIERVHLPITEATSEQAKVLDGSYGGFQPKPAVEIVIVAMKPLDSKTYVDQALKNGKGVTWLDDARVPFHNREDASTAENNSLGPAERSKTEHPIYGGGKSTIHPSTFSERGRFPANLLVSDDALNDGHTSKSSGGSGEATWVPPIGESGIYGKYANRVGDGLGGYGDSGSFSRYFDLDRWWDKKLSELPESVQKTFPFLIVAKASKSERNQGLEDTPSAPSTLKFAIKEGRGRLTERPLTSYKNVHPTVKPLKLMSYLVTLGSRPNDVVLDPFIGSGTTAIAAHILGRHFVGIELNPDYCKIAEERLRPYMSQTVLA
jgi:site-specific DNA-methyltransferase (adenine-specific)